jgi:hypothetical protein
MKRASTTAVAIMYELGLKSNFYEWLENSGESSIDNRAELCETIGYIADEVEKLVEEWDGEWIDVTETIAGVIINSKDVYTISYNAIIEHITPMILIPK